MKLNLLDALTEYGFDRRNTMERFVHDEALFTDCLHDFLRDETFDRLEKAIAQKDYKAAFEYAHALKGVCGNLGLTPLYNAICFMVEPLRARQYESADALTAAVLEGKKHLTELVTHCSEA